MPKVCPSCGANIADDAARFCSSCGNGLAALGGTGHRFEGGRGNMLAAPNATFHGPFNQSVTHHHGAAAPPLDLSPTFVTKAGFKNKTFLTFGAISAGIGFVSGLFGIFGTNIFEVLDRLGLWWEWLERIPFFRMAFIGFGFAAGATFEYLRHVKLGLPAFDKYPFVRDDRLHWIVVRRVCPRCRGTMTPTRLRATPGFSAATVWECARDRDHRLPYDHTEVEDAIKDGRLGRELDETA